MLFLLPCSLPQAAPSIFFPFYESLAAGTCWPHSRHFLHIVLLVPPFIVWAPLPPCFLVPVPSLKFSFPFYPSFLWFPSPVLSQTIRLLFCFSSLQPRFYSTSSVFYQFVRFTFIPYFFLSRSLVVYPYSFVFFSPEPVIVLQVSFTLSFSFFRSVIVYFSLFPRSSAPILNSPFSLPIYSISQVVDTLLASSNYFPEP